MNQYPLHNLFRTPFEIYPAISLTLSSYIIDRYHSWFPLTADSHHVISLLLLLFATYRAYQGIKLIRFQKRLLHMPHYALSTCDIPTSKKQLFLGKGFRWRPIHTQRLYQLKQIRCERYLKKNQAYQLIRHVGESIDHPSLNQWLNSSSIFNPFKPLPPVGGNPYLHGLGDKDKNVYIPEEVRSGHTFVVGTTRVGKTRLASTLITQDIRNGHAVIIIDPKGDHELIKDIRRACMISHRLKDFRIVHLGFPKLSAHYNPLKCYHQISEVATRITDAIAAEGEGKQFAAFAWKYVNIVAICLEEMNESITYQSIAFYISRLDQLLMRYADIIMPALYPEYTESIEAILNDHKQKHQKKNKGKPPLERSQAVIQFIKEHINKTINTSNAEDLHDQVLIELYDAAMMDKHYYDKITASVGPVLSEINKSNASNIICAKESPNDIELLDVIKNKKILYIGLDSLTNPNIAQAVGKALLSDLVSTAGKIYKDDGLPHTLNIHCDELSEVIQSSFLKILNKAGGAGFQVTAYAQTIQDMEVALGSKAKASVSEGNFNTLIMLRVKNEETANLLVSVLPHIEVTSSTALSSATDKKSHQGGTYFTSNNEDRIQTKSMPLVSIDDIISLPKGQAFVLVNGGELYKIRIPLPVNTETNPCHLNDCFTVNQ